jgi:hypothetical protein
MSDLADGLAKRNHADGSELLRAAIALATGGSPILPLDLTSKRPLIAGGYYGATINPATISQWWHKWPNALIAVATGVASGLAVLDLDPRHGADLGFADQFATRKHRTRGGGLHLIFEHAEDLRSSSGKLGHGIDVRAQPGCFVWWPAHGYEVLSEGPIATWPADLIERHQEQMGTTTADRGVPILSLPTPYQANYANKALRNRTAELIEARPGTRNNTLNVVAYQIGRFLARGWLDRATVDQFLLFGAERCGLVADDGIGSVRATLESGLQAGMKRPYHDI